MQASFPIFRQVVLDSTDNRALAEFYRELLGYRYRPGDEPAPAGEAEERASEWLVIVPPTDGEPGASQVSGASQGLGIAFQQVESLRSASWPDGPVPQQAHLDLTVPTVEELDLQHARAMALGARLLEDRSDDEEEPIRVYADPAGHPFCIFVVP